MPAGILGDRPFPVIPCIWYAHRSHFTRVCKEGHLTCAIVHLSCCVTVQGADAWCILHDVQRLKIMLL